MINVQPARGHVRGHQHRATAVGKLRQHLVALALLQLAVQRQGVKAVLLQPVHQVFALLLGVAKRQRADRAKVHEQLAHRVKTVGAGDLVKALLNLALRLRGFDFDVLRRFQKRLRQLLNALGVGGREQQGLPLFGRLLDDFADVLKKAHVQHAVGLVEHQGV